MHLRRLKIENVRGIGGGEHRVDVELPSAGWIVVAGPNGSGKTTLLRCAGVVLSNTFTDDFSSTLFEWKREQVERACVEAELVRDDDDVFDPDPQNRVIGSPSREELSLRDDWSAFHGALQHRRESQGNLAFLGPWSQTSTGWFVGGYGAHRRLLGVDNVALRFDSRSRESSLLTLFRDESPLVEPVRWLMDLHHRSLDPALDAGARSAAEQLLATAQRLLNDGLLGAARLVSVGANGLMVDVAGAKVELRRLGAGAQVLVALVLDVLRHMHARFGSLEVDRSGVILRNSGVVLIDEAETHLHVAWQRKLGPWLTKHFPSVQFIVSTHSPFVCQSATERGLLLLPAPGAREAPRIADAELHHRAVHGGVDDVLLSELFGLEHTWTDDSETKRQRVALLEGRVLTGRATTEERDEYKRLRREVVVSKRADVDIATRVIAGNAGNAAE